MSTNEQFDELFRKALPSVDVPAAPELDWTAMAGLAKTGGAAGGSSGLWTSAWLKVLGGTVALLVSGWVLWKAADNDQAQQTVGLDDHPANTSSDQRTSDHTSLVTSERSTSFDTFSATESKRPIDATGRSASALGETAEQDNGLDDANTPSSATMIGNERSGWARSKLKVHVPELGPGGVRSIADVTGSGAGSDLLVAPLDPPGGRSYDGPMATAFRESGHSASEPMQLERMAPLGLRRTDPILIPEPASPVARAKTGSARFSIAPWVAFGNSVFDHGNGRSGRNHLEQLGGGREMLGTIGLRAHYNLDERLAVLLGVQYANKGGLKGRLAGDGASYTEYSWSGRSIETPLAIRYALPRENKEFYVRLGGTLQFNARGGTDRVVQHNATLKETSTLVLSSRSIGVAVDLGIGVQFRIARGIGMFVEPSYQYALAPVVKHPAFKTLTYNPVVHSIGLGTGIVFQFPHR